MSEPVAGPVADFCAELGRLVRACHVPQRDVAEKLGRSKGTISDFLNGRRRRPPDWEDVRLIVVLCAERLGPQARPPSDVIVDVIWWRRRHAQMERTVEASAAASGRAADPGALASQALKPGDHPAEPGTAEDTDPDVADCIGMGIEEAIRLLAAGRGHPETIMDELLGPLYGEKGDPGVLDRLLKGFPTRVRAVHGVRRGQLFQAARVVLAAAALVRCGAHRVTRVEASRLVRTLVNGAARAHVWSGRSRQPADTSLLAGARAGMSESMVPVLVDHYLRFATPVAAVCPEFALAAGLPLATETADQSGTGLAGLAEILAEFAGQDAPGTVGNHILNTPIASLDVRGPQMPSLADGYVTPRFRLAGPDMGHGAEEGVASDKWWEKQPSYNGLERFLAAYLLSLPALLTPLLVLGHPGAGKSLLTKLLQARVPAREFRPLRVELRHTPADADLQKQLEHALYQSTGRPVSWPDWSESEPGAIPVVLLDGFDELLQSGAHRLDPAQHWGYLQQVADFQEREARLGRPLVVVVTSRTVVADRAAIPRDSQVLRLEPFGQQEVSRWLAIWNAANTSYYQMRNRPEPLRIEDLAPHTQLTAQPLLLLMLALYDAVSDSLHPLRRDGISQTQLYESLLTEFVRRQIVKDGASPASEEEQAVQGELHRLSVIALGMFQRGSQAITAEEADHDLQALGDIAGRSTSDTSELLFGRFFFVHEAQAVVAEQRLRTYEFMHATFGEHLAARLIDRALHRLVEAAARSGNRPFDEGELYALLSFVPLTNRAQLVLNLSGMLASWPPSRAGGELPRLLTQLFEAAPWGRTPRTERGHSPARLTRTCRETVYGANLILIGVLAAGDVNASQFLGSGDLIEGWRRQTMAWQSQFTAESWELYSSTLAVERFWHPASNRGDRPMPDLRISRYKRAVFYHNLNWPLAYPETKNRGSVDITFLVDPGSADTVSDVARRVAFVGDRDAELLLHAAFPLLHRMPSTLRTHHVDDEGHIRSVAQSLMALFTSDVYHPAVLPDLYDRCLTSITRLPHKELTACLEAISRQLVNDAPALDDPAFASIVRRLNSLLGAALTPELRRTLLKCVHQGLGRGDQALNDALTELTALVVSSSAADEAEWNLLLLAQVGHSSSTWTWSHLPHGEEAVRRLDKALSGLDLETTAARHPAAIVSVLRLAADLGLDDWLTARAAELLEALPRNAFGLLRPSDLGYLRRALPTGVYAAEFNEVERIWGRQTPRNNP
ncbi:helix-turn-helix domain-containing protein [Streptomyces sp. NPDC059766]|uniref:helix-turn-helix domain-containing protein n=1 Tax=Streptomyces sp. NPDC059766 TaxID=3346940 RepID=UPI003651C91A